MEQQMEALAGRIARLERSTRAMKVVVAMTVAGVLAMSSLPQALSKTTKVGKFASLNAGMITASQINLVDSNGKLAAVLASQGGSSGLVFFDSQGKWAVAVGTSQNGSKSAAGLAVYDGNQFLPGGGVVRAALGVNSNGAGLVALDTAGNPALVNGVSADGTSAGSFAMDSNQYARAGFGNSSQGSGFWTNDANNITRYVAGVGAGGTDAGSATYDSTGNIQFAAGGVGDASQGGIVAYDSTGQDRFDAGYSATANSGGIVVKDAQGNVTYTAP